MNSVKINQKHFGPVAQEYVRGTALSGDFTLRRLVELTEPKPDWMMLDIGTGGGHTCIAFAPHVRHIIASDVTREMLEAAQAHIAAQGVSNVSFESANAMQLPYEDASFDVVTCRLAAHHFDDVPRFLAESHRVLRASGILAIVDSHLPNNPGGDHINRMQGIHDPSHVCCLSKEIWHARLQDAGFELQHCEEGRAQLNFDRWIARGQVPKEAASELRGMLVNAPPEAARILDFEIDGDALTFYFQRLILIAKARSSETT